MARPGTAGEREADLEVKRNNASGLKQGINIPRAVDYGYDFHRIGEDTIEYDILTDRKASQAGGKFRPLSSSAMDLASWWDSLRWKNSENWSRRSC